MRHSLRALGALLAFLPLAACDDGTGPERLTATQVAGRYSVCTLVFTPENTLFPAVDVRTAGLETSNAALLPSLALDAPNNFELEFVRKGQNIRNELAGSFAIQSRSVLLDFVSSGVLHSELLLPDPLRLDFQSAPQSLRTSTSATSPVYEVPRADYARLAGVSEAGLSERIRGRISAHFQVGGCS